MNHRRGFTIIELITVMILIGILSAIAVLKYIDITRVARTAQVAGAFGVVRIAAWNYEADHQNTWPADASPGVVPPEMVPYLPAGFAFTNQFYTLDWENFTAGGGGAGFQLGITVTSTDSVLVKKLIDRLGGDAPFFVNGNSLTYILIDASGNY